MPHSNDPHRPLYHYSPNLWMNDVIPFIWNGELHQFYDYNPREAAWTNLSDWGHGVARDKIHWEELPPAFVPSQDADKEGCWTGCVVAHEGKFYGFYTGIPSWQPFKQVQCLAISDDLQTWMKYENNPIIADTPEGFGDCFRDPQVWREGDEWVMIVGGELEGGKGGAAFLYTSRDLLHWEYSHVLCEGQTQRTGYDYECPDFFELDGQHVFLSSRNKTWWQIGEYSNRRFEMQTWGPCDSETFYAAKTTLDEQGRRLLLGWIRETRGDDEVKSAGWGGVLSLPRVLSVGEDNSLHYEPLPELQKLRGQHQHFENLDIAANEPLTLPEVSGDALEIIIKFAPNSAQNFGAKIRCSPDASEYSQVLYSRSESKLGDVPLTLQNDESLTLHIFIDRSVIETFANNRACLTQRFYPQNDNCLGVQIFADSDVVIESVDVWQITP